jgi:hypothetical protein
MSGCSCQGTAEHVANFAVVGFGPTASPTQLTLPGVQALAVSACVSANYNSSTGEICINFPVIGSVCFKIPIPLPAGELKVCASTCGTFIPKGLKATVYVNNAAIWTGVIWGSC